MSDKEKDNFLFLLGPDVEIVDIHPGEVLFEKGDRAIAVYVVKSGRLEIFDGPFTYETVTAGDLIGEMALIDEAPRSASIRAVTECEIIPIDAKRFITMVERTPTFAIRVMRTLVRRLRLLHENDIQRRS
jgi:CRP/FNR family cyclic AMP-dependent transcriptional regulator